MKTYSWITKTIGVLLILIASISLFLAQSSYWVNHTVFNQENFSNIVGGAVLQPTSRDAIASQVVESALQDRPIAKRVVGDRAQKLVGSLLDSDLGNQAVNRVVSGTYKYITTPNRQDITLELAGITTPVTTILNLVQAGDSNAAQTVESIPDEIVIVQSDAFPNLSGVVSTMLWVGPLFWLVSLAGFAAYIYMYRKKYAQAVYVVGASIAVVALIGILARPALPPPIASMIPASDLRVVASNVTDALLAPFQTQMVIMLVVTAAAMLIFSQRYTISRWIQKLGAMIARETAPKSDKTEPKSTPKKK